MENKFLMLSLSQLALDKLCGFLSLNERIELSACNKTLFSLLKVYLTPQFDLEIEYLLLRTRLTKPTKKKKNVFPVVEIKNTKYHLYEDSIFSINPVFKSLAYNLESTEDGLSVFTNKFDDKMILHSSLLETFEKTHETYECLINANDLNSEIDFANPAMLLKRQKNLLEKINKSKEDNEEQRKKDMMRHIRNWGNVVIILCHGGNFNIAGFNSNGKLIESHSDHKYVSRKKQGGRQIIADKQGGAFSSKGASIRRENEKKHGENIENIIEESKEMLDRASLIFLHAPGNNYYVFVSDKGHLEKWKKKIRPVGITTSKAKFQETERVFKEISTIKMLFKI